MNKQITEDYVSYEFAVLLKEKGFDEPTRFWYDDKGIISQKYINPTNNPLGKSWSYAAPTQSLALKWLREVHSIFISIMCCTYPTLNKITWIPDITTFESVFPDSAVECNSYEQAIETALLYVLKNLI